MRRCTPDSNPYPIFPSEFFATHSIFVGQSHHFGFSTPTPVSTPFQLWQVGARAGRLSRVLRFLRFLPFLAGGDKQDENQPGAPGPQDIPRPSDGIQLDCVTKPWNPNSSLCSGFFAVLKSENSQHFRWIKNYIWIHLQISATKWGGLGLQYRLPARIFLYKQEGLCPPFCIWNHFVVDSFQIIIFIL